MSKCSKNEQPKRRLKRRQMVRKGSSNAVFVALSKAGDRAGVAIDFHHRPIGNNPRRIGHRHHTWNSEIPGDDDGVAHHGADVDHHPPPAAAGKAASRKGP
jgi:hypothetical protein